MGHKRAAVESPVSVLIPAGFLILPWLCHRKKEPDMVTIGTRQQSSTVQSWLSRPGANHVSWPDVNSITFVPLAISDYDYWAEGARLVLPAQQSCRQLGT